MINFRACKIPLGGVLIEGNINGQIKRVEFPCTAEAFLQGVADYKAGALMQDAFPFLKDEEREFLISGTTSEEWNNIFPPEEQD